MKHPLQPGSLSGAVLRSTRRVDGVEVDVHYTRRLPRDAQRNDVDGSTPQLPRHHSRPARRLQASRSAATASTHRVASAAAPRAVETALGRRARRFTSSFEKTSPTKSKRARNPKRNHPPPSFLETSRLSEVKPPLHDGAPRYDRASSPRLGRDRRIEGGDCC